MGTSFPPAIKSVKTGTSTDAGLTLTYESNDTSVIAVNGINLEPKGVGTATITVSQAGDTNYNAATSKTFTITVTEKSPYSDSVPGLVMWLDGKDINGDRLSDAGSYTNNVTKLGSRADRSGNANTRTQSVSAHQPTYTGGGGLTFDGNDSLSGALPSSLSGNPGFTAIIVADATSNSKRLIGLGSANDSLNSIKLFDSGRILYSAQVMLIKLAPTTSTMAKILESTKNRDLILIKVSSS